VRIRGAIERAADVLLGVQTWGYQEVAGAENNPYSPVPWTALIPMLMSVPKSSLRGSFVDLGCGKGRVLTAASFLGFSRVVGVEIDAELCVAAERNRGSRRYEVVCADACKYVAPADTSVLFLGNPFVGSVLETAMRNNCTDGRLMLCYYNTGKVNRAALDLGIGLTEISHGHNWAAYTVG